MHSRASHPRVPACCSKASFPFVLQANFRGEKSLLGHQRWVWDCVFSADSAYLVTASSDQTARLWDVAQGETIRHYTGHHKAVTAVALHDRTAGA